MKRRITGKESPMGKARDVVYVKETNVGKGLFARARLRPLDVVAEVRGTVVDDPDHESDYCIDLGGDAKLEPRAPFRFLNHCCEPNCELVLWKKQRHGNRKFPRVWVQVLRDIEPDDELTIDYAWPAEAAIPCQCASRKCRQWIVNAEELDSVLAQLTAKGTACRPELVRPPG
jgi:uncharacterized protein